MVRWSWPAGALALVGALACVLAGCGGAGGPVFEAAAPGELQGVVLVGWDGAQRAHLQEMMARDEVPNLVALGAEGALVDIDITSGATDTKAGWTQILTGYTPETTGVWSNYVYTAIPEGYTIFERLKAHFGALGIYTGFIAGKKLNMDDQGPGRETWALWAARQRFHGQDPGEPTPGRRVGIGTVVAEDGQLFVDYPPRPYYITATKVDLFVNGLMENRRVGERALRTIADHRRERFLIFVHFAEPDETGHACGENSQEYTDAIHDDDVWLGRIIARLRELGLYERTLVYVTSDHGFDEGGFNHRWAPYVFLATNDARVSRDGDRADVGPTVLKRFGVDVRALQPPLAGVPLDEAAPRVVAPPEPPG